MRRLTQSFSFRGVKQWPPYLHDNHYTLLTHDLMNPILLDVKARTKTGGYVDTLLNDHTSKLGTRANTDTRHQNGVVYRRILLNLNAS